MVNPEKIDKEKIKKILCIKPRGIGDVVLSTIILENLLNHFRHAKIDYLTEPFAKPSLENNPLVNKVITMGKSEFSLKVAFRVRREKYDMILDLWSNPRTAQITFFSGVKYRVGFAYRGRKYAYNILATSGRGRHHISEHNLELVKALNIPVISKKVHYYIDEKKKEAEKIFVKNNFPKDIVVIGIVPSGGWESKRCEKEKWVEICDILSSKYQCGFLIIAGPGDEKDADFIIKNIKGLGVVSYKKDLNELAALLNTCDMIIANDSGPMHIAAALNKPVLGLFGPTDPYTAYPYGLNNEWVRLDELFCICCNLLKCPYNHECFKDLPVDRVMNRIDKLIMNNNVKISLKD